MERRQRNILGRRYKTAFADTRSTVVCLLNRGVMVIRTHYGFAL